MGLDPVMLAAFHKNFDIAEALLSLGADPVVEDKRFLRLLTGEEEPWSGRMSELMARAGYPTDVQGMLTGLKTLSGVVMAKLELMERKRRDKSGEGVKKGMPQFRDFREL